METLTFMETLKIFAIFFFGILMAISSAKKALEEQRLVMARLHFSLAVSGVGISVFGAFILLPLWGAILWTSFWAVVMIIAFLKDIQKKRVNA